MSVSSVSALCEIPALRRRKSMRNNTKIQETTYKIPAGGANFEITAQIIYKVAGALLEQRIS